MLDQEGGAADRALPGTVALGERLVSFKRFYRWLNLTLIQHAVWPLLVLLTSAHGSSPEHTDWPWYLPRLAAPVLAAALAWVYLRQQPLGSDPAEAALDPTGRPELAQGMLGAQLRLLALGLPAMLAAARLIAHPTDATVKLLLYGAAEVAAYHLISFGVVARSYPRADQGRAAAVILLGLSWAIHDALLVGIGGEDGSMALAFASGLVLGWIVGTCALAVRESLGGFWPAAALHWFVVYLIFGFTG